MPPPPGIRERIAMFESSQTSRSYPYEGNFNMKLNVEQLWDIPTWENWRTLWQTCFSAAMSAINLTWIGPESGPSTNGQSHGTDQNSPVL